MALSNCRVVWYNDHDDAVLTPSAAAASGFEVTNTQNSIRGRVWRTTSSASQSFTGVWPENRTVSHFSMHRHLCHAGSVRFELFSDAGATTQVFDSTTVSATPYTTSDPFTWSTGTNDPFKTESAYWLWFDETTARSYRVTFSGTPSQSYWQVSRVWVGRYFQVAINPDYGYTLGYQDLSDRARSRGGSLRTNSGNLWRIMNLDFQDISDSEVAVWLQGMRQVGTGKEFLISIFPGDGTSLERDNIMVGKVPSSDPISRFVSRSTKKFQVEES